MSEIKEFEDVIVEKMSPVERFLLKLITGKRAKLRKMSWNKEGEHYLDSSHIVSLGYIPQNIPYQAHSEYSIELLMAMLDLYQRNGCDSVRLDMGNQTPLQITGKVGDEKVVALVAPREVADEEDDLFED